MTKTKILFVCMGNICRSPSAEGVFRKRVQEKGLEDHFEIDSAGTHGYHVGSAPDKRSVQCALSRDIDIRDLKARRLTLEDGDEYDYILVMDQTNLEDAREILPRKPKAVVKKLLEYGHGLKETDVPDPYYGGANGFEHVLDLLENACAGLLDELHASV